MCESIGVLDTLVLQTVTLSDSLGFRGFGALRVWVKGLESTARLRAWHLRGLGCRDRDDRDQAQHSWSTNIN